MTIEVNSKIVETDVEGFLVNLDDWTDEVPEAIAQCEGWELKDDKCFGEHQVHPTMHVLVQTLGRNFGNRFHEHNS